MKKTVLFFVAAIASTCAIAQKEYKFGEVTKEELSESSCSIDKSANAAVLYKKQDTYFMSTGGDTNLVTEIYERIKIYNKDGFDYATEYINLFKSGSTRERVSKIKAVTHTLENDEIVSTELDKDQVFQTEVSFNYEEVKFTMPNVKEGAVIEFQYTIRSPFIWNIDEFRFQYSIPILDLDAEIRTPDGFKFKPSYKGYLAIYPETSVKTDHRLGMTVNVTKFHLDNVPALKEESYVDNINNYRAGVMFELVSIELPQYFRSYAHSWSDVAKTIGSSDDYKNQLDKTRSFEDELDALLVGAKSNEDKMRLIFNYVKENVTWNGLDGKYFYNGLKKTLKEKKGNAADINLLVVAMLRYAGIYANPVVISTKDNAVPYFPTVDRLNYVIAYAVINDEKYFLDATEEFSDINVLPIKDYNWQGILIDNENMKWDMVSIKSPKQTKNTYMMRGNLNEEGELEGQLSMRLTEHGAFLFRKDYKNKDQESHLIELENNYNNIEISNYEVKGAEVGEGYVTQSFEFLFENASEIIDGKMYLKPMSFLRMENNPFKVDERLYPIDFGHPFKNSYSVMINVPDGYSVETSPASMVLKLPKDLGEFKYLIKAQQNSIHINATFEISKPYISAENYAFLKEYFNTVITKQAEQVVLKKII